MLLQLLFLTPLALSQRLPLYPQHHSHACNAPTNAFPFCNTSLPLPARVTRRMKVSRAGSDVAQRAEALNSSIATERKINQAPGHRC